MAQVQPAPRYQRCIVHNPARQAPNFGLRHRFSFQHAPYLVYQPAHLLCRNFPCPILRVIQYSQHNSPGARAECLSRVLRAAQSHAAILGHHAVHFLQPVYAVGIVFAAGRTHVI
ncbi:MAG: hypothetical protein ACK56I_13395, partial [bacterium]